MLGIMVLDIAVALDVLALLILPGVTDITRLLLCTGVILPVLVLVSAVVVDTILCTGVILPVLVLVSAVVVDTILCTGVILPVLVLVSAVVVDTILLLCIVILLACHRY